MHINKRKKIDDESFDFVYLQKLMRSLFSKHNDYASIDDLKEVTDELHLFGVLTKKQLRLFLKKHRKGLIEFDKERLSPFLRKEYQQDIGKKQFEYMLRRRFLFSYAALIRTAMEVEFGDEYEQFTYKRDGIEI